MILHVTDAKHICAYQLEISFNNGRTGIADLSDSLEGEMFSPLKNDKQFSDFCVDDELETIVWKNGADLAPEYLYFQAFKHEPELQPLFKKWGYRS
jgi:hypothetical protein